MNLPVSTPSGTTASGTTASGTTASGTTASGTTASASNPATADGSARAAASGPAGSGGQRGIAAQATDLVKVYGSGDTHVRALNSVSVDFARGEFTAIMGPSGSGKSTLMHCLAGLDTATSGSVRIGDTELTGLSDKKMTQLRRDRIGFVFQAFNLLPTVDAGENITLPLALAGRKPDKDWLRTVIDTVGLGDRLKHRPSELSGGQQQRVAVARALASKPELIFADEPTGNLDSRTGGEILTFMRSAVDLLGQTIVMVTHDAAAASHADTVLFLADGRIVDSMASPSADRILDRLKAFGG
jgi:putative ABC transport system ATP-binding protein